MNETSKVICEADMRCDWTSSKKAVMTVYYILFAIFFYSMGPAKNYIGDYGSTKYIWGHIYYSEGFSRLTNARNADDFFSDLLDENLAEYDFKALILGIIITIVLLILPIFIFSRIKAMINESSIELETTRLKGYRRLFNSRYTVDVPIELVRSISYKSCLIEKFTYGCSILIKTDRGNDIFHGVRNADRFIEAVQKEMDNCKKDSGKFEKNVVAENASGKIKSLKEMFDNGLITQEEFETKKSEILSKM